MQADHLIELRVPEPTARTFKTEALFFPEIDFSNPPRTSTRHCEFGTGLRPTRVG
jgi:hypothetical protein